MLSQSWVQYHSDRLHEQRQVAAVAAVATRPSTRLPGGWRLALAKRLRGVAARLEGGGPDPAVPQVLPERREQGHLAQLTRREREVSGLVARGLSNREIAASLVISERTAQTHVENVLRKLGYASRVQVATWAVVCGLYAWYAG